MTGRLEGKVAVITGGASGMGLAAVERFVVEGAAVVLVDLPPLTPAEMAARVGSEVKASMHHSRREPGGPNDGHAIAERLGDAATFVAADITIPAQLAEAVDTAVRQYGGLDVMFNNAGIGGPEGSIVDCSDEVFDRVIDVDLKAVWRGIKLAAPRIAERGGGSIISTASVAAILGFAGLGAYGAAKAGVTALTRVAAMELAPSMIRVNAILPGGIVTPILYDSPLSAQAMDPDVLRQVMVNAQPLPRSGEPVDIANAALWLASDESAFVTGQSIVVDGGMSIEPDARARGTRGVMSVQRPTAQADAAY
ncbi:MAG TPA: SDR family oxidoreductase [Acidimicrobiales bacterium]|nr:SDR family oxidoreductase [Acidimicrobiales bacterium]